MTATSEPNWPRRPSVGVGCIVVRGDHLLMVRSHRGFWSTPGGHLEFGETPAECAARETEEETGVQVTNIEFVAITNDLLPDTGKHYVTIWMRADAGPVTPIVGDPEEIAELGWFAPDDLPRPLFRYLENLIAGRSLPAEPPNLPFATSLRASSARSEHDV